MAPRRFQASIYTPPCSSEETGGIGVSYHQVNCYRKRDRKAFITGGLVENLPPCLRDTPIADRMVCLADHKDCWQKRKDALLKALAAKARLQIHIPED